jgi:hypothetical protein
LPSAREDWVRYFRWQLCDAAPPAGMERLGVFGGSESMSANYEMWRWGAVAGVLLWAIRNQDRELAAFARRWFVAAAALGTLVSTSRFPEGELGRNKRGERLDTSRWMGVPSHRSNMAHAYHPCGVLLDMLLGRAPSMRRPREWFHELVRAADLADRDQILGASIVGTLEDYFTAPTNIRNANQVCNLVDTIGIYGAIRVIWWRDTRAVILDQRRNPNTPAIMFEVLNLVTGELYLGYPWPAGRAFKAAGQIQTIWDRERGELSATSAYGLAWCRVPVEEPELEIVMDEQGARVERQKGG